jgi:cell wall-associated NlpC family hydrolase
MKFPVSGALSMGSRVTITGTAENRGTAYLELDTGQFLIAGHAAPVGEQADDFVAIAETLLHTPYLWGGSSAFGIDCSGLVQLAMRMAGKSVLRDTDMQAMSIGKEIQATI